MSKVKKKSKKKKQQIKENINRNRNKKRKSKTNSSNKYKASNNNKQIKSKKNTKTKTKQGNSKSQIKSSKKKNLNHNNVVSTKKIENHNLEVDKQKEKVVVKKNNKIIQSIVMFLFIVLLSVILYFVIDNVKYDVIFDYNDGSHRFSKELVKRNEKLLAPEDLSKDGYIFDGWYRDGEKYDFNQKVQSNIILKAKWFSNEDFKVKDISLSENKIYLDKKGEYTLNYTIDPKDAVYKDVFWSSTNDEIVTVDTNGKVKAKNTGKASVYITTTDGGYTDVCSVIVVNKLKKVKELNIDKKEVSIKVDKTKKIDYKVKPNDATDKRVIWKSEDESIATVDSSGKITAKKVGETMVIGTTKSGNKEDKIKVIVKKK